jgi:hypothetical protein
MTGRDKVLKGTFSPQGLRYDMIKPYAFRSAAVDTLMVICFIGQATEPLAFYWLMDMRPSAVQADPPAPGDVAKQAEEMRFKVWSCCLALWAVEVSRVCAALPSGFEFVCR